MLDTHVPKLPETLDTHLLKLEMLDTHPIRNAGKKCWTPTRDGVPDDGAELLDQLLDTHLSKSRRQRPAPCA